MPTKKVRFTFDQSHIMVWKPGMFSGRSLILTNQPSLNVDGHEFWIAERRATSDYYWRIRTNEATKVCLVRKKNALGLEPCDNESNMQAINSTW